jgi:hypothetical protein
MHYVLSWKDSHGLVDAADVIEMEDDDDDVGGSGDEAIV